MSFFQKLRRMLAGNANKQNRRDTPKTMKNAPWDATYDRSGTAKDLRGAVPKDKP